MRFDTILLNRSTLTVRSMLKTSSPKVPDAHRNVEQHLGSSCTANRAPWRVEDATDGEWQWSLVDGFNPGNVTWNL